jgi:hypothetical protein
MFEHDPNIEVLTNVVKPAAKSKQTRLELHRLLKEVARQNLTEGNRKVRRARKRVLITQVGKKLKEERALGIEMEKQYEGR